MKTAQRLTPADRNRAVERLRVLTAGATFLGISATVGFSWLAASSNPGTQASASTTTTTTNASSSVSGTSSIPTSNGTSSSSSSSSLGSTSIGSIFGGGPAHVSGGGS